MQIPLTLFSVFHIEAAQDAGGLFLVLGMKIAAHQVTFAICDRNYERFSPFRAIAARRIGGALPAILQLFTTSCLS